MHRVPEFSRIMKNKRNYYRILHVQPDAPQAIIKSSYRTLMHRLKQHPDLGGDHCNAALINEAYAVISDPAKRAEYDRVLLRVNAATSINGQEGKAPNNSGAQDSCTFCGTAHGYGKNPHQDALCRECSSPLKWIEKLRLEKTCRRMVSRIAKHMHIEFYTAWPQKNGHSGIVRDISLRGMQFVTDKSPKTGTHIKVECETCTAVARVMNYEKRSAVLGKKWVVGIEFVTILFRETRGSFISIRT